MISSSYISTNMFSSLPPISSTEQLSFVLFLTFLFAAFLLKLKPYFSNTKSGCDRFPPGPKPWPLIGNFPEMLIDKIFRGRPTFCWIHDVMDKLGTDIACVRLGNVHVIPVRSPELAREFLKKNDSSFASRPLTQATECLSRGYLSIAVVPHGEQWKKMRRLVTAHVTNPSKLNWLRPLRDQEADNLVRFVYNQCKDSGRVVDVRLVARQYCGNVVRKMLFGQRYFGQGRGDGGPGYEEIEHVESAFKVLGHIYVFSLSDYFWSLRSLDLDGHGEIVNEAMKKMTKYQDVIVDERLRKWRDGRKKKVEDMLDLFILAKDSMGQNLSSEEIKAQCADLTLASLDNPSNAVEWALAEMINQPEVLRKATNEIDNIVGKETLVQESHLPSLPYVTACLREALRLHPVAPFVPPHVSVSDAIVSGYFIPKDSHVLLSRIGIGRNPKVWNEPLVFRPERHLKNENEQVTIQEPDLKFISFSTGRRGCIGVNLGSTMTVMLLARLLQAFSWKLPSDKHKIDLTESTNDLYLKYPLHLYALPRLPVALYRTK